MYGADQNRREFLQCSALGLGVFAIHSRSLPQDGGPTQGQGHQTAQSRYLLTLDGVKVGFLRSVEGGSGYAEVITEAPDPSGVAGKHLAPGKHLGPVKYEPFAMQFDFSVGGPVFDWIAASWRMDQRPKNGTVVGVDYRFESISQREFFNALLVETTIPAMDAASKDPGFLSIKVQPESVRSQKASGTVSSPAAKRSRSWLPSGFRFEIDGLDSTKVSRIESFTVRKAVVSEGVGEARDYAQEPGSLEIPNLAVQLSRVSAEKWIDWHEDFVIKGNNGADREKRGRLVLLSPDLRIELAEVRFFGLGIYGLSEVAAGAGSEAVGRTAGAGSDAVGRLRAELYCERMEFSYNSAVVG